MNLYTVSFLRSAPFVRILVPFVIGIITRFYVNLPSSLLTVTLISATILSALFTSAKLSYQYRYSILRGCIVCVVIASCGGILMHCKNTANHKKSLHKNYETGSSLVVKILEPLTEKTGSYKTLGEVQYGIHGYQTRIYKGKILIYFSKDSTHKSIKYGDIILVKASLQHVSSTRNPAAFDFKEYCYRQGIHFQVYLAPKDVYHTGLASTSPLSTFIFWLRKTIVAIIDTYVKGKKEAGLAEALLIGYKDNLDKDLIQSYSNTGVVHVIAISGLHLGLIYAILIILVKPIKKKWLQVIFVLAGIWIFTLLAGASPSVVRSAVMFSCIAFGNALSRKASVYNSLAASAFILLSYDPFWLWDTGFQLSYSAVLSIIIFQKPVYHLMNIENKLLDLLWKTCAVTLAAQILTTPVTLYYFHQFPVLFLAANLIAIPLSSAVLIAEIILCMLSFVPPLASVMGWLVAAMIRMMNTSVELIDGHRFANWEFLRIDFVQLLMLYIIISASWIWLYHKLYIAFAASLFGLMCFFVIRSLSFFESTHQHLLIIYNIPRHSAVEFIKGRKSIFLADSSLLSNNSLQRFHIRPARIFYRFAVIQTLKANTSPEFLYTSGNKTVVSTDKRVVFRRVPDVMIISGKATGRLFKLIAGGYPAIIVFDSSVPKRKLEAWQKECDSLKIRSFSVQDQGAFVMNLN